MYYAIATLTLFQAVHIETPTYVARIPTGFDRTEPLFSTVPRGTLPVQAPFRIVQHRSSGWFQIQCLGDLTNHVYITCATDALSFVRLSTSLLQLSHPFDSPTYEIIAREALSSLDAYGDKNLIGEMFSFRDGEGGVVSRKWLAHANIRPAMVRATTTGWLITRPLVSLSVHKAPTVLVATERVSKSGSYSISVKAIVLKRSLRLWWRDATTGS